MQVYVCRYTQIDTRLRTTQLLTNAAISRVVSVRPNRQNGKHRYKNKIK